LRNTWGRRRRKSASFPRRWLRTLLTPQKLSSPCEPPFHMICRPRHRFATARALLQRFPRPHDDCLFACALKEQILPRRSAGRTSCSRKQLLLSAAIPEMARRRTLLWTREVCGIYPGVDVVFYGNQRHWNTTSYVAPGADPKAIRLDVEGARKLRVSARGDVVWAFRAEKLTAPKPVVYQIVRGERREIAGRTPL